MKVAAFLAMALLGAGCGQGPTESPARPVQKADPILGTWVCIADNGGGFKGSRMELRADGVAVFTYKSEKITKKYRQESGSEWIARRRNLLGKPQLELEEIGRSRALDDFERPGVVMVYFQENGHYVDYGGNLLMFIPEIPVLYNLLTQAWCRPGDENRVTEIMSR
jgi:hypothetical protein